MSKPHLTTDNRAGSEARRALPLVAGALVLLAAALRIYGIGNRELWIDEANAIVIGWQNLPDLIGRLRLDSSPPLYYVGLHFWMLAFGTSDAATRSLSVLGGVLLVFCSYRIGRRWFGEAAGLMAAALLAVAPIQIFYSQTVRMYSWLPLLALLSTAALARAIRSPRPGRLAAYGVLTLAALYTHNFAMHLLPAHALLIAMSGALRRATVRWLICAAAIGAGYLPWLPVLREQLGNKAQYGWFDAHWKQFGPGGVLWESLQSFSPGGTQPPFVRQTGLPHLAWLPVLVVAGLAVLAAGRSFWPVRPTVVGHAEGPTQAATTPNHAAAQNWVEKRDGRDAHTPRSNETKPRADDEGAPVDRRCAGRFLTVATAAPLGSALLSSMLLTPNFVPGRTDQLVFPGFVLLVAVGLTLLPGRCLRYGLLAGLLIVSLTTVGPVYRPAAANSDRDLARAIVERARPGDAVVTTSLSRATLEVYLRRAGSGVALYSFPPDTALHLGNQSDGALLADRAGLERTAADLVGELSRSAGPRRVFVVLALTPVNQVLYDKLLATEHRPVEIGQYRQAGMPYPLMLVRFEFGVGG